MLQPDGTRTEEEVSDYALRRFRAQFGDDAPLPDHFVTAQDLTPAEHVRMRAAVQRHVDSAISKTVNVPEKLSACLPLHASQARCLGPRHAIQRVGDCHHRPRPSPVRLLASKSAGTACR